MSILVKQTLHSSVAESVFREIGTRGSKYFFFLGKTTGQSTTAIDKFSDELRTRESIVLFQEIKPSDACLVVRRIDWKHNEIYDKYDDNLSTQLAGINIKNGGYGYSSTPTVVITNGGPNASGATAVASIDSFGRIVDITVTNGGSGYIQPPTITFTGAPLAADGFSAVAQGVINKTASGVFRLEQANFYVLTNEFNVYKCLNNNYNGRSTIKPRSTIEEPIQLSDGYVWKYMYTIPAYLRNKFLTSEYMPVINNLNDNFYSNGEIGNVGITNSGTGYTWAKIRVDGDGYSEKNPFLIEQLFVNSGGSNYQVPTLSFQPPFVSNVEWSPGFSVLSGEIVSYNERYYRVTVGGDLGTTSQFPIHRIGTERNGSALLEFIGETAKASLITSQGSIIRGDLIGRLSSVEIEVGGSGYLTSPSVTIMDGQLWESRKYYEVGKVVFWKNRSYVVTKSGISDNNLPPTHTSGEDSNGTIKLLFKEQGGASAYTQTLLGTVSSIKVSIPGDNYTEAPTVIVGELWYPNTYYSAGKQIFYGDNLYTVTQSGTSGDAFPAHTSGELSNSASGTSENQSLKLKYAGLSTKAKAILQYGYGYTFLPEITIDDPVGTNANIVITGNKSSAKLTPVVANGSIVSVVIEDSGIGYTYNNLYVEGDGQGAVLKVDNTIGDVNSKQGNSQLLGEDGTIHHIELLSGGYGWSQNNLPSIRIVGDGEGATATPYINLDDGDDKLLKIEVVSPGKNYRWANVEFVGGSGRGAKARAVISPYLGHGKDAVSELFATKLMFYTVFSGERLFEFDIVNEYREVGIIKNPRKFANKSFIGGGIHTPCVIVSAPELIDRTKFFDDMEIRSVNTNKKYRIVAIQDNMMLLENLQNDVPEKDEELDNQLLGSQLGKFTIESVVPPTVDKYSGELLYIESRAPFKPSKLENVTLRSVISF